MRSPFFVFKQTPAIRKGIHALLVLVALASAPSYLQLFIHSSLADDLNPCVRDAIDFEIRFQKHVLSEADKNASLKIMLEGSQRVSRTVVQGRRFFAPAKIRDLDVSQRAEVNFKKTAQYVINHIDDLTLNRRTAILLNRMLTEGLVPEKLIGNMRFRLNSSHANQTDTFVGGNVDNFYLWLESEKGGKAMQKNNPVGLAEIIHNNIHALDSFPDGNGRLSRLLADLVLLKAGLAPAYYTDMIDYFKRGTCRGYQAGNIPPVSRSERKRYFDEIVLRGQKEIFGVQ